MDPYLLLAAAEGCGPGMVAALLDPTSEPEKLLRSPPGLPPAVQERLRSPDLATIATDYKNRATAAGLTILTPKTTGYPDQLQRLPLRPNVLYAQGDISLLSRQQSGLTIVGSRTHSAYGQAVTKDFAGAVARAGVVIWSGLAHGVDALAHREALAHNTPTVAVLAGGLDHIYPVHHTDLAQQIVDQGGLLISETPPGVRAQRGHFPRRNRILAGATRAVLVVEAGLRSGTLHTARFASEFGVPVFAVPGPYTSPRSVGCHSLIAEGAGIAGSPAELLRDLGVVTRLRNPAAPDLVYEGSADEELILHALTHGPRPTDLVARESGLADGKFLAAVFNLTSKHRVQQLPGDLLAIIRTPL
jgi:DNA processing protein